MLFILIVKWKRQFAIETGMQYVFDKLFRSWLCKEEENVTVSTTCRLVCWSIFCARCDSYKV